MQRLPENGLLVTKRLNETTADADQAAIMRVTTLHDALTWLADHHACALIHE
jgi:hypothetical protein